MDETEITPRPRRWLFGDEWPGTRCGARTRAGTPCRKAALSGKKRCRIHGGEPVRRLANAMATTAMGARQRKRVSLAKGRELAFEHCCSSARPLGCSSSRGLTGPGGYTAVQRRDDIERDRAVLRPASEGLASAGRLLVRATTRPVFPFAKAIPTEATPQNIQAKRLATIEKAINPMNGRRQTQGDRLATSANMAPATPPGEN